MDAETIAGLRLLKLDFVTMQPGTLGHRRTLERWDSFEAGEPLPFGMPDEWFAEWILAGLRSGSIEAVEPGVLQKIGNLSRAVARDIAGGRRRTTPAERRRRWSLCMGSAEFAEAYGHEKIGDAPTCELLRTGRRMSCKHPKCGCNLKTKIGWADEFCPLKKWIAEEIAEAELAIED
jgi:hypothetical protein